MKLSLNIYLSSDARRYVWKISEIRRLSIACYTVQVIFTNIIPSYVRSMDPLNSDIERSELSKSLRSIKACFYYSSYRFGN